mgnify:CR=1 FL=1
MKETIYNYDYLNEEDITEISTRVKALIINSDKEILLGKSDISYQFPGGHLEDNESLIEALKREVLEETGIKISDEEIDRPFYKVTYLNKDYPVKGVNRKSEIYYYVVNTDKEIDLSKMKLTENETKNNYRVEGMPLLSSIDIISKNDNDRVIERDMIDAIEEYLYRIQEEFWFIWLIEL